MASQSTVEPEDTAHEPGGGSPERRRKLFILGAAAVGAAALAVGVVYGPTSWQILQQRDTSLSAPERTAGLTRDTSSEAEGTAEYLRTALAAGMSLDDTMGAVYLDPADASRAVIFIGGTAVLRAPETDLDRLFELVTDEQSAVTGITEVPAGALGGVMKCGVSSAEGGQLALCGWADHGSVAIALFPGRTPTDAAELLRTMRADIQHR